jgi:predicted ATPase/DNA-binding CsgD family transcriptional regulator
MRHPEWVALALDRLEGRAPEPSDGERSARGLAHNLPVELTSFIGREQEVADLVRLMGTTRLLTLTGPGGVGKTRLALRMARELLDAYADGVWYVDLASLGDPRLVGPTVAQVLDVRDAPGRPLIDRLAEIVGGKYVLLVLDNCEHLKDACAELVEALVRECPGVAALTTSRAPLGVPGEVVWRVQPLAVPPDQVTRAAEIGEFDAVRLFLERAKAAQARARYSGEAELQAIVEVCRRLDGLPLAIELAAARTSVLSPQQIVAQLLQRFRLLRRGGRSVPPRHQTLAAAIASSDALLAPLERSLFHRLAVFAGGWTLDAAELVCAGDGIVPEAVLDLLSGLIDTSLVAVEEPRWSQRRYRLLESIRAYAQQQLDASGEATAVRDRHLSWMLDLAQPIESGGDYQIRVADRIEPELDNLRAALGWCLKKPDPERGLQLSGAVRVVWHLRGSMVEGRSYLDQLLTLPDAHRYPSAKAGALQAAAVMTLFQGDPEAAQALLTESEAICREHGDAAALAHVVYWLGVVAQGRGEYAASVARLEECLELSGRAGLTSLMPWVLYHLSEAWRVLGQSDRAARYHHECLRLADSHGLARPRAYALLGLGHEVWLAGKDERAVALHREGLRWSVHVSDQRAIAIALEGLAWIASRGGRAEAAAWLLGARDRLSTACAYALPGRFQAFHDRAVAAACARLGDAGFRAAWAAGQSASLDDAIAMALDTNHVDERPETGLRPVQAAGPLTRRERQVAALIAQGRSNRGIAQELVITEATAAKHIEHILNKLGVSTRAEIAVWVAQHELLSASTD